MPTHPTPHCFCITRGVVLEGKPNLQITALEYNKPLKANYLNQDARSPLMSLVKSKRRNAVCLDSPDNPITDETQKHEALKTHTIALIQQLFPSPEDAAR